MLCDRHRRGRQHHQDCRRGEEGVRKPLFVRARPTRWPRCSARSANIRMTTGFRSTPSKDCAHRRGAAPTSTSRCTASRPRRRTNSWRTAWARRITRNLKETIVVRHGHRHLARAGGRRKNHAHRGVGIGGGTITGLASLLLNTSDISEIIELARARAVSRTSICRSATSPPRRCRACRWTRRPRTSARCAGAVSPEDAALGILNMVLQCIGKRRDFSPR